MFFMKDMAAFMVVLGGLGAGIDFLLSDAQKETIKDWLLAKWVEFNNMKLADFSHREAQYFVELSDRLFGARFLSWRRLLACCAVVAGCAIYWLVVAYRIDSDATSEAIRSLFHTRSFFLQLNLPVAIVMLASSISLTRWLSMVVIRRTASRAVGIGPYVLLIGVHAVLFFVWRPVIEISRDIVILVLDKVQMGEPFSANLLRGITSSYWDLKSFYLHPSWQTAALARTFSEHPPNGTALKTVLIATTASVSYVSNGIRIGIALAMVVAFTFRRWLSLSVDLVWRRLIESKLPAFTLLFTGVGAIGGAIKGLLDILFPDKSPH